MTVEELIQELQTMPPDLEVRMADWNEDYAAPYPVGVVSRNIDKHGYDYVCLDVKT